MIKSAPSIVHLRWSIEGRARTQTSTLRLYELIKNNQKKATHAQEDVEILTAISFSLWRAVFLADRKIATTTLHATKFLEKMLIDNTISFSVDRENRGWTFTYYVEVAEYNLEILAEHWDEVRIALDSEPQIKNTPRNRWNKLQTAFESAIQRFEKELRKRSEKPARS